MTDEELMSLISYIKQQVELNRNVKYKGSEYKPLHFTYWYNKSEKKWEYSVVIQDITQKNSVMDVQIMCIEKGEE